RARGSAGTGARISSTCSRDPSINRCRVARRTAAQAARELEQQQQHHAAEDQAEARQQQVAEHFEVHDEEPQRDREDRRRHEPSNNPSATKLSAASQSASTRGNRKGRVISTHATSSSRRKCVAVSSQSGIAMRLFSASAIARAATASVAMTSLVVNTGARIE